MGSAATRIKLSGMGSDGLLKALLLVAALACAAAAQDRSEAITVGRIARSYQLYVPPTVNSRTSAPLLLVFHGAGGQGKGMARISGFDQIADREGFIVVYPNALHRNWNDTRQASRNDDVAFVRAIMDEVALSYRVDRKRVYATGISNGGFFAQRLACELSDGVAAVASVAATMPEPLAKQCLPSRPVSVMFIQGTKDPLVPINGGNVAHTRGRCISLEKAAEFWRDHDGAVQRAEEITLPVATANDRTNVRRAVHSGGKDGSEVVVYTVEGGGHTWPGGPQYLPATFIGHTSHGFDASQVIWDFFKAHSQP